MTSIVTITNICRDDDDEPGGLYDNELDDCGFETGPFVRDGNVNDDERTLLMALDAARAEVAVLRE